jgi:hypothetical protein
VVSEDADNILLPSAVNATPFTPWEWPRNVEINRPLSKSHTLKVLSAIGLESSSSAAETKILPSGVNAKPRTDPEWPNNLRSTRSFSTSHIFSMSSFSQLASGERRTPVSSTTKQYGVGSVDAATALLPSAVKATQVTGP